MLRHSSSHVLRVAIAAVLSASASPAAMAHGTSHSGWHHAHREHAPLELSLLGSYSTGLGAAAAEIVAYDPKTARLFISNAATSTIDIVSLRNPAAPTKLGSIDVSSLGVPNSVAVHDNVVAVAIEAVPKTNAGHVAFYKLNGEYINAVAVGAQPDMLTFTRDGRFLLTANEGDARDWPGFSEEARVGSLTLDSSVFPDASTLRQSANLGRLNVTTTLGNADGVNGYEALYTLGGRSFSIWTTEGMQVFDSDADFERITAAAYPAHFNASNEDNTLDSRSDNKGPEPEGLAIGRIGERTYAFIGLERIGGVMMYDISTPHAPVFVDYANHRDFSADVKSAQAGDLGPEGLTFIAAHDSPNGRPMLAVANEISGTVSLYEVKSRD